MDGSWLLMLGGVLMGGGAVAWWKNTVIANLEAIIYDDQVLIDELIEEVTDPDLFGDLP